MRRLNITVFDEFLSGVVLATLPVTTTTQELNTRLGQFDQLGIFAVVDNIPVSTTSALNVQIEHSSDGRNWLVKNAAAEIPQATAIFVTADGTKAFWGSDPGTNPSLGFVRLRIWFSTSVSVHLRIHVTCRDMGG